MTRQYSVFHAALIVLWNLTERLYPYVPFVPLYHGTHAE